MRNLALSIVAASIFVVCGTAGATGPTSASVVVPRGQPVQIAFAINLTGFAQEFGVSIAKAVQMALEAEPQVRGFDVQLNVVNAPCAEPVADAAAAAAVVANPQNVAVLGQLCSAGFEASLPIYEAAGIPVITGSATRPGLSAFGPSVFNRTVVDDNAYDAWFPLVDTLPSLVAWRQAYEQRFGVAPLGLSEFYYDATLLLLDRLHQVSKKVRGDLVIDRAKLARAIRQTTNFKGVTCTIRFDPSSGDRVSDPAALDRCARKGGGG